jgi:hypothetical protein
MTVIRHKPPIITDFAISYYRLLISHIAPCIINEISSDKELRRKRSNRNQPNYTCTK